MFNFALSIDRRAERWPDEEAVTCGAARLTNAGLSRRVDALAAGLRELGLGRGDVIAILLHNCVEFLESTLAISKIGGIFLPLNFRLASAEWEYLLRHSGASALITAPELASTLPPLNSLRRVVVAAGPTRRNESGEDGRGSVVDYGALVRAHLGETVETADVGDGDVQRLMYTSGTASQPKGVALTHGNVLWKIFGHLVEFGFTRSDRTLLVGPMYHVGAFDLPGTGVFYVGGSWVILPQFDAARVMETIEAERPTNIWLAPAMVNAILRLDDLGSFDTSSVRLIINGGEKMPVPLVERIIAAFPDAWFADAYGLTETVSGDTFVDRAHVLSKAGSVGKPVALLRMRIVGEDGSELPPGERGEILLQGPKVFRGYWKDPTATSEAIVDGWFRTGDVGTIDSDGYLYVEDRKKDMIVSGGENIATPEVERVLYQHPDVVEAAVIGVSDTRWGEVPMAFVVTRSGSSVSGDELRQLCAGQLARFKVPREMRFVDALPRNPSGKVLKRELRRVAEELAAPGASEAGDRKAARRGEV